MLSAPLNPAITADIPLLDKCEPSPDDKPHPGLDTQLTAVHSAPEIPSFTPRRPGFWRYISGLLSPQPETSELQSVLSEGRVLRLQAEQLAEEQAQRFQPAPATGHASWKMAAALLLAGAGAGSAAAWAYGRYRPESSSINPEQAPVTEPVPPAEAAAIYRMGNVSGSRPLTLCYLEYNLWRRRALQYFPCWATQKQPQGSAAPCNTQVTTDLCATLNARVAYRPLQVSLDGGKTRCRCQDTPAIPATTAAPEKIISPAAITAPSSLTSTTTSVFTSAGTTPTASFHPPADTTLTIATDPQNSISALLPTTQQPTVSVDLPAAENPFMLYKRGLLPESKTTPQPSQAADDIRIEKLYDFSCIEARANLTLIDMLRQVSKTLQSPITQLSEEARVIHSHNTQHHGCPPPVVTQRIRNITSVIDVLMNTMLTLLPHSQPLAIVQQFIGPMLEMIIEDLVGNEAKPEHMVGLNQQLIVIFRQSISTLTTETLSALYQQPATDGPTVKDPLARRFTLHEDQVAIQLEQQIYNLIPGQSGHLWINEDDIYHPVRFNLQEKRWEIASVKTGRFYSREAQQNKAGYGIPLSRLSEQQSVSIKMLNLDLPLLNIIFNDAPAFLAVTVDEVIVPVEIVKVASERSFFAAATGQQEKRVLIYNKYGWEFEPASVDCDNYLGLLLSETAGGETCNDQMLFTAINEEGLCHNQQDQLFIKNGYRYYPVRSLPGENSFYLFDRPNVIIYREDRVFKLKESEAMLFPFNFISIGLKEPSPDEHLQLEFSAAEYLRRYGVPDGGVLQTKVAPSLYLSEKNKILFSAGDKNYKVSRHQGRTVFVQATPVDNKPTEIALWFDDDAYIRVRNIHNRQPSVYREMSRCRPTRAPGQQRLCLPVMIEASLDDLLSNQLAAEKNSAATVLDTNLVEANLFGFPSLFQDTETMKHYFLYQGHYFRAEIIHSWVSSNPTGKRMLKLFTRGDFFNRRKGLTTLTVSRFSDRIELKTAGTFVAEALNLSRAVAEYYLANRFYRRFQGMNTVEDAINHVLLSGEVYVDPPRIISRPAFPFAYQEKSIIRKLFAQEIVTDPKYTITMTALHSNDAATPAHVQLAQEKIRTAIEYITTFVIPSMIEPLDTFKENFHTENALAYLRRVLKSDNEELLINVALSLQKRLKHISHALKSKDIYLASAGIITDYPAASGRADTTSPLYKNTARDIACLSTDSRSLYINIDKLYPPGEMLKTSRGNDIIAFLIHEASHINDMTGDIVFTPRNNGYYIPVCDAVEDMLDKIRTGNIIDDAELGRISRDYLENITVYRSKIDALLTNEKLSYLARNDPGMLAHLLLNSADMLTLLTLDLYKIFVADLYPASLTVRALPSFFSETDLLVPSIYRSAENLMAKGSIGTLYDIHNGYVIKDYSGTVTPQQKSRLRAAMNNASAMNRLYGSRSATVILHPEPDGSATVSVRMIKVPGTSVSDIIKSSDRQRIAAWRHALEQFITPENDPSLLLAKKLQLNGIHDHDINEANVLFDEREGFQLIDFDWIDLRPENTPLSTEITSHMAMKLKLVMLRLGRFVGMSTSDLLKNLNIVEA